MSIQAFGVDVNLHSLVTIWCLERVGSAGCDVYVVECCRLRSREEKREKRKREARRDWRYNL